ncbi:WhiB family transcriptional regulator [uncultured Jatrophihabitans sp.]|uniref:WhiB family transcriptional regulator n=1 Tax=uncultured Jatrophihabitans sp. TaxID=1610747 RepID=UPI0035C9485B
MTSPRADWRERAACAGVDPELFFPVGSGIRANRQAVAAKRICAGCPVIERCRDLALRRGFEGIWGGLDDDERRRLRARRPSGEPPPSGWTPGQARSA